MKIVQENGKATVLVGEVPVAYALGCEGAADTFVRINDIAYIWKRHTDAPVTEMQMHLTVPGEVGFMSLFNYLVV